MTIQCPWCEYEGLVPSVEAHISGKSDEDHRGKVGHDLREHLPQTGESGESSDEGSFGELPEDGVESSEESSEEGSFAELHDSVEDMESEESSDESSEEVAEEEGGSSVPPGWALVGATALFAVVILLMTSDFGSTSTEIEADGDDEEVESTADEIPLIEGAT